MNIAINNKVSSSYKVSIFYLVLLCIVAGSGWFTTRYLGDKARQEILQFNESTILTHSSHIISEFDHIEKEVRVLSGSPLIAPALISRKDVDIANANSALDRYNAGLDSSVSYLIDGNGVTIASSNRNDPDSFVGQSYQFRPYFMQAIKGAPGIYFALGVTSLKRGFYTSYPVRNSDGHTIGVVVIKQDIDDKEADLGRYPYFFLVDPNGVIFLSSRRDMTLKSLWPMSRETRLALLESEQFGKREFDTVLPMEVVDGMEIRFDGRDYLTSRKVINPEGWSTVIMTSTERILQYKLAGVVISMWICTLILVPMIIHYRTSRSTKMLHASETRYRELFDNTSSGVAIYEAKDGGRDFILKNFNKAGERIDGVRKEDIIGKSIHEVRPGIKEFGLPDVFERVWRTGIPEHYPSFYHDQEIAVWYENFVYKLPTGEIVAVYDDITDRKRAEEALRGSEEKYRRIVETANEGILLADEDFLVTYVNQKLADMLGCLPEEIIGKQLSHFMFPEDLADDQERRSHRIHGLNETYERRFRRSDGRECWANVSAAVLRTADGRFMGSFAMLTDITERKRAEEALRESEELYRSLVNLSPDAISVADLNGQLTFASPKAIQMFGNSPDEEVIGRSILCWVAPEEQEKASTNIQRLLTEGTLTATEFTLVKKDGTRFIGEVNAAVIHSPDGSPMSMIIITRDVTERKQAEEEILESENKFKSFAENALAGIYLLQDGVFKYVNPRFAQMFGYTVEECLNDMHYKDLVYEEDLPKVDEQVRKRTSGEVGFVHHTFRGLKKNGQIFHVEVYGAQSVHKGEPAGTGTILDITDRQRAEEERKKLEEQLFQAQKMESVGRLAGGVAHDFNNMLGVIIGMTELALNQDVPNRKLRHNLEEILKAGLRSADLTRQLLAFARKQTAIPKVLDLNDTISGMLKMLRRLIGEDTDLSWQPGLDLWKVKIDPSQVDQILANLAVNARDAISGVGAITIRTENVVIDDSNRDQHLEFIPGEYVLLTVSDTGDGMSKEVSENIFEPFFTTKDVGKGTGLGLSTVYGIVKQNDGFIYVESEPGKGATFNIYLPRHESESAQVACVEVANERPTGTETILLVEDDDAILNLSKMILESLGYTVVAARTPVNAVHLAEEHPGDLHLLITDVVMPEMNGRELAEQLRAVRPNLKCLYMSGYTADVIAHRGLLDEGVNFIQKPFGCDDFALRIRKVLDRLE